MKYKSSFPNIFKIKDKISAYFSVASQNGYFNSSKYQNKGQRSYLYIFDRVTFKWIHFLKGIVVCSNFFPVICTIRSTSRTIFATFTLHAVAFITQSKELVCIKAGMQETPHRTFNFHLYIYIYIYIYI